VLLTTGMHHIGVGQWARGQAAVEEAADIAERLGDWRRGDQCRGLLAIPAFYRGELDRAARIATDLRTTARRRGDTQMELAALTWIVEHALAADTPDRAAEFAEEAGALVGGTTDRLQQSVTNALLALARMRRGEQTLALQAADEAAQLIALDAPMGVFTRDAYPAVAEVYLTHWEAGNREAERAARQACAAARRYTRVFPIGSPVMGLCQGWAEWLDGRPGRARRVW
jgi:eukaryotic-like serine/threonine-protein kinase